MKPATPHTLANCYEMIQQLQAQIKQRDKEMAALLIRIDRMERAGMLADYC